MRVFSGGARAGLGSRSPPLWAWRKGGERAPAPGPLSADRPAGPNYPFPGRPWGRITVMTSGRRRARSGNPDTAVSGQGFTLGLTA